MGELDIAKKVRCQGNAEQDDRRANAEQQNTAPPGFFEQRRVRRPNPVSQHSKEREVAEELNVASHARAEAQQRDRPIEAVQPRKNVQQQTHARRNQRRKQDQNWEKRQHNDEAQQGDGRRRHEGITKNQGRQHAQRKPMMKSMKRVRFQFVRRLLVAHQQVQVPRQYDRANQYRKQEDNPRPMLLQVKRNRNKTAVDRMKYRGAFAQLP